MGTSVVGVGQEDPTKLSPGSSDLEKPDRLTEKQLKEVSVAVDIFGMETVSDGTGGRRANMRMVPCIISYSWTQMLGRMGIRLTIQCSNWLSHPRTLLKTSYCILVDKYSYFTGESYSQLL